MWYGKNDDDSPDTEPEEDNFSMTANFVHCDENFVPKKYKLRKVPVDDGDDFSMTANYFHD